MHSLVPESPNRLVAQSWFARSLAMHASAQMACGNVMQEEELEEMTREMDVDRSGSVEWMEFATTMQRHIKHVSMV
eukprot:COSAG05_NODE_442_length_9803_cov_28.091921_3_plen_76_part_00